ncbi:MAG TPA: hypothetical protein VLE73_04935 [Candidatus Saccharimonadales bacterium]|nr:hypothetical protein [Candidatus Saccharimonadales bacterium]
MNVDGKNIEQPGGFTSADKITAQRALCTYSREIHHLGLRWEFDLRPEQVVTFLRRDSIFSPRGHLREIDEFLGRVRDVGGFVADLATFKGRPITHPVSCTIGDRELVTYGRMHSTMVDYIGALLQSGPDSREAAEATIAVAQVVNPNAWREAGVPGPSDVIPHAELDTQWYLQAVVRAPEVQ